MTVRITHPNAIREDARDPPSVVPTGQGGSEVDTTDGSFDAPDAGFVERLATRHGLDPTDLLTNDCPFCEDTFESVSKHAVQVHPGEWDEFTGGGSS